MPLLFSYGTLQQDDVQVETFGRQLTGQPDELPGFEVALVTIENPQEAARSGRPHHANVTFAGHRDTCVRGTVFEITDDELAAADRYERPADYHRISATLASGRSCWLYVHASTVSEAAAPSAKP